jgi:hypothetical protein
MTELEVGQRREPFIVLTVSTYAERSRRASVPGTGRFALPLEQAMVFANEESPIYMIGASI